MSAKLEYCPPEDVLFNSHVDVLESDVLYVVIYVSKA